MLGTIDAVTHRWCTGAVTDEVSAWLMTSDIPPLPLHCSCMVFGHTIHHELITVVQVTLGKLT